LGRTVPTGEGVALTLSQRAYMSQEAYDPEVGASNSHQYRVSLPQKVGRIEGKLLEEMLHFRSERKSEEGVIPVKDQAGSFTGQGGPKGHKRNGGRKRNTLTKHLLGEKASRPLVRNVSAVQVEGGRQP